MNPTEARKRIVQTYRQTGNSCKTARRGNTSPQRVRKGVQRYQQHGEAGLLDQPKTPKRQPRKTPPEIEPRVLQLHQPTRLGRLTRHRRQQGLDLFGCGLGVVVLLQLRACAFGVWAGGSNDLWVLYGVGVWGSAYVGLMRVVLLDEMVLDWSRAGLPAVKDVLAHYSIHCSPRKAICTPAQFRPSRL
jgi:transposase-like protein